MSLFDEQCQRRREGVQPLAVRMRPRTLDEFVGQEHLLGEGKLLRRMFQADRLTSALFYGPSGTGKTTLAHIIAGMTHARFEPVHAASVGVKEIRAILEGARSRLETTGQRSVLFVDELHRFNRGQQDVLLADVEDGLVILLGATTENPFFAINTPLLSRSQIFQFHPLSTTDIEALVRRALRDKERGLGTYPVRIEEGAIHHLAQSADGDARRALAALEVAVFSQTDQREPGEAIVIDEQVAADSIQRKVMRYDRAGDAHYDTASALIKSIRGSDPDAAVYWLACMLEAGEDPRFIARRLVIAAAEDIGNADPMGLVLAQAAADATAFIGLPECQLPLAQAAIYLACAEKSNSATRAIGAAREDARTGETIPVPVHLRDASYPGAKRLGHGGGYEYPHNFQGGMAAQDYLGVRRRYYNPTDRGAEVRMGEYLARFQALRSERSTEDEGPTAEPT